MSGACALIRRAHHVLATSKSLQFLLSKSQNSAALTDVVQPEYAIYKYASPLLRNLATARTKAKPKSSIDASDAARLLTYDRLREAAAGPLWQQGPAVSTLSELKSKSTASEPRELTARVAYLLRSFRRSPAMRERALAAHVNNDLFSTSISEFSKLLQQTLSPEAGEALGALPDSAAHEVLLPCFLDFTAENYALSIESHKAMVKSLDLTHPHTWFPIARSLQRKIIYHAGPTNSGKTFNAMTAMRKASSGVYCGPLRLLAMEIYDSCNVDGTFCNLVTGQERREVPGAAHTACTVEMANLNQRVDVAVLDEIQMIGDASRGHAWTRALLGVPATEVHVCGDGSAVDLVQWMAREMGEDFELRTYERFTKLEVESSGLKGKSYASVRPGDCIVAFSRYDIYDIKAAVEAATPYRACVIYGALPPEVRRRQARLFNDPDNDYSVMVASDAVGMGLNLNIGRVVFHSLHKREGAAKKIVAVNSSAVKQIAGRAGRRSSQFSKGRATCFDADNVPLLSAHLAAPLDDKATPQAGLVPEFDQFEAFASQRPETPFSTLLQAFEAQAVLQGRYFFCRQEAVAAAANLVEGVEGLSLKDMYVFALAPASSGDPRIMAALIHWAKRYAAGLPCPLDLSPPSKPPETAEEMRGLESAHSIVMLWLWLSYRFEEETFPNREEVQALGDNICFLLGQGLENITALGKQGSHVLHGHATEDDELWLTPGGRKRWREKAGIPKASRPKQHRKSHFALHSDMFAAFEGEVDSVLKAAKQQRAAARGSDSEKESNDEWSKKKEMKRKLKLKRGSSRRRR